MKKFFHVAGFFFFSFLGGAVAGTLSVSDVGLAAYQMLSVWTGGAGNATPSWVSTQYGFGTAYTTSQNSGLPFFSISSNGRWGGLFASRSSDNVAGYTSGQNILAMYDHPTVAKPTWGQYIQAEFASTAASGEQLIGSENSIWNQKTVVSDLDPFQFNRGDATINSRLDCGVGTGGPDPKIKCTNALSIVNNGAAYASPAVVIANTAQDTSTDSFPTTIALPANYSYSGYTSAGVIGFKIFGGAGSPAGIVPCTARCLYLRTDGGAGSTLYINETGGGTSGWAAK